ncbi:carbohydrate-binding protein [Paenibacillus sp. GCM10027626]
MTYNGKKYQAKWWTQNERPDLKSGQWDVWQLLGDSQYPLN